MIQCDVCIRLCLVALREGKEIGVALVRDGHDTTASISIAEKIGQSDHVPNTEELSSGRTKCNVGTSEVMDRSLREHGVVFQLRLAERGAVAGNQDELGCRTKTCPRGEEHAENTSSAQGTFSASRSSPRRD